MSIIQDCYSIFDNEYSRLIKRQVLQDTVELEITRNLAFLREALKEQMDHRKIVSTLEEQRFQAAVASGLDLNTLKNSSLSVNTFGNIKEFKRYQGWSTDKLIKKGYERINVLKKLLENDQHVDVTLRLQSLFKFLLLLVAHIEGRRLTTRSRTK